MKKLILFIASCSIFTHPNISLGQSLENEDYQSYNQIVDNLNAELRSKTKVSVAETLSQSSYSLAAGLQSQFLKINNSSKNLVGANIELGVYNFLLIPLKARVNFVSGRQTRATIFQGKTDISIYQSHLVDVKMGISGGFGSYRSSNQNISSLFLSPSVAAYYQLSKNFDVNFELSYSFHASDKVSDDINPSLNLVSYF